MEEFEVGNEEVCVVGKWFLILFDLVIKDFVMNVLFMDKVSVGNVMILLCCLVIFVWLEDLLNVMLSLIGVNND